MSGAPAATAVQTDPSVARAYEACARIVRTRARNFYYGLRLTPEPRRSAVYSIYAWMRLGDDSVDEAASLEQKRENLAAFARTTRLVLAGEPADASGGAGDSEFWPAFAATMRSYPIRREWIDDMILGLGEDLEPRSLETMAELERYCYRVASTVGLVCVAIWGLELASDDPRQEAAHRLAVRLGQAFQITNILRDFAQDFDDQPRRVYVPREVLARHGVGAEDVRAWARPDACEAAVRELWRVAEGHYAAAAPLEAMLSPPCRPTLWAMTRIYRGILARIGRRPRAIVEARRVRLSGAAKTSIAARAWLRARLGR